MTRGPEAVRASVQVPLLDLRAQYATIRDEIRAAVDRVLESQALILGPEVEAFEREAAAYCGTREAVGLSSGTDALLVALMALGVGPGDEVLVPSYSFFATAGVVARLGALPVFLDIERDTFNVDPREVERKLTPRTMAIVPVHLFGQVAELAPILELARARGVHVVEDAAQAIGAELSGRRAGSFGAIGCFSFYPTKNLGAAGDAGLVTTDDPAIAERIRVLRVHGASPKYFHELVGGNFRLDALQAAILRVKLRHLEAWHAARQRNADRYDALFQAAGLAGRRVELPARRPDRRHVFNQYVVRVERRDALMAHLRESGIGTEVYYPRPLHLQECFAALGGGPGDLPESERAAATSLALPIYPELADEQIRHVVASIGAFFAAT